MQSLPLRPLKLTELKELAEREEDLEKGKAEEVDEEEVDEEEEEMLETRSKKKKKLRISGTRRRRGGRSCTLGGLLLGLLLLGCLAMGVVLALKMLQVPVDYGAPLRETRAAFETVRSRLQRALTTLDHLFLKPRSSTTTEGDTSPQSPPTSPPVYLLLPLAKLRSILASRNTTLEAVAAKYCTTAITPPRVNVENNTTTNSSKADDSELLPPPPLLSSCSTINWPLLADQIRAVLVQKGSAVQVSLSEEGGDGSDGDEGDEGDHHQTLHLSIGYLPPSGGSLSILKTGGGDNQLFQVEMASSEHEPEVRLEVAWILPLLTGSGGGGEGESDADAGIITLLMVTPDRRHCLLELFGPRQLSCKLS